ncbi:MAG: hypothetical protein L3K04_02550 [Thermoplasmata archaeon]|nr:hypothetical protein [Thermoplasmata archaeon]MCI4341529.1 hypothetical protein [Thermoplasmata archaeon]
MRRTPFYRSVLSAEPPRSPSEQETDGFLGYRRWVRLARRFALEPQYRRLRRIVLVGLLVRLLLAPVSSWDFDTPGFVLSGISTVYTGNPYASSLWANPPLAPYLAAPLLAIPTLLWGPQSLVAVASGVAPVTVVTGVNATFLPSPIALLAWKLPLLLADLGVALLLYLLPPRLGLQVPFSREGLAAAWFLNPLVIWSSAVHGEVDSLAILLVLLSLYAVITEHWYSAGLLFGLGVFTKAYPLVLLPLLGVAVALWPSASPPPPRQWLRRAGRLAAGVAVGVVAFLSFLPQTFGLIVSKATNPNFGGMSLLILYNRIAPGGATGHWTVPTYIPTGLAVLSVFRIMAVLAVLLGAGFFAWRLWRRPSASRQERFHWLFLAALWAIVGVLLSDSVPQPENVVALLPLMLLTLPAPARWRRLAPYVLLSGAGLLMYWAFLTPLAMLYPGAALAGPAGVAWVNGVVLAYVHSPLLHGVLMTCAGVVGGAMLLLVWAHSGWLLLPEELRPRRGEVSGDRTAPAPATPV